ncbi:MAG: hypothetical protein QME64_02900 [bacterium]|nr:hypothetical protein [bacterium]
MRKSITFDDAINVVESLPEDQRESLIEIVHRRLIDERRNKLAQSIKQAKKEFASGAMKQGTVDDLMRELSR